MSTGALPKDPFAPRPPPRLYSVPRRYDLATLMAVTLAYALLFAAMRLWDASPAAVGVVSLFVTVVGLAQAVLFRGRHPRAASLIGGAVAWFLCGLLNVLMWRRTADTPAEYWITAAIGLAISSVCPAMVLGYLAGTLVAGVFLVADLIRKSLRLIRRPKPAAPIDWEGASADAAAQKPAGEPEDRQPIVWATIVGEADSPKV